MFKIFNKRSFLVVFLLILLLTISAITAVASGDETPEVSVQFSFVYGNGFEFQPQALSVRAGTAFTYGIGSEATTAPTVLDAVAAAHKVKYGEAFTAETAGDYLSANMQKVFSRSGFAGHAINGAYSADLANAAVLNNNDIVELFLYEDPSWLDYYTCLNQKSLTVEAGEAFNLSLSGFMYINGYTTPPPALEAIAGAAVGVVNPSDGTISLLDGKVTDSSGQVALTFNEIGTYMVAATGNEPNSGARLIPAYCVLTVVEPANYVTVRIEANGLGTDGINDNIQTVLPNTMVNLSSLPEGYKAIDAVNYALTGNDLPAAGQTGGFYTAFGGVSGSGGAGWLFFLNDESAAVGLDPQSIESGDNIVLMLSGYDGNWIATKGYTFFRLGGSSSSVQWGYPYGEATLFLNKSAQKQDWSWGVTPVGGAAVYSNGSQAYTPASSLAVTDAENGAATITLWGGASAGTYYFDITAEAADATSAYCRAKMVYDGTNNPVITFSQPSAADTSLASLDLSFTGVESSVDALPYLGGEGLSVNNAVTNVRLNAGATADAVSVSASYQKAGEALYEEYILNNSAELVEGDNVFKITVTNGTDRQVHTLVITRQQAAVRDIPAEVNAVINGVKTVTGDSPHNDWILAMSAAGLNPTSAQLNTHLAAVLVAVDNFVDEGTGTAGTMAKTALALTSLGIDVRQIPDPDGGAAINLIEEISAYNGYVDPVWHAPYILELYDLGNYAVPVNATLTREALINAIIGAQAAWTAWGVDGIGMVLPALAPYYQAQNEVNGISLTSCNTVTAAVDRALLDLEQAQSIDGGFGSRNSNTTSTIITGLAAVGINPHTDARFVKSGSSLLTNLLSFRTAEDKLGFNNNTANDFSCLQGFQALAVYQNLTSGVRNANLYHFTKEAVPYTSWPNARLLTGLRITSLPTVTTYDYSAADNNYSVATDGLVINAVYNGDPLNTAVVVLSDCSLTAIDRSQPGTQTVTVSYQNQTVTFMVTVKDEQGAVPIAQTVSVTVRSHRGLIAAGNPQIEAGSTSVLDVLRTVINEAGKALVVKGGSYVASIDGLGEFDEGANSGWLYSVNGVTPSSTACGDYILQANDVVLWYYTLDYSQDSSSAAFVKPTSSTELKPTAVVSGGKAKASVSAGELNNVINTAQKESVQQIVINPQISGKINRVTVELPISSLENIAQKTEAGLTVKTSLAELSFSNQALGAFSGSGNVGISLGRVENSELSEANRALVGDHPVFDLSVTAGGQNISDFGGGELTASLPYTPKDGENTDNLTVYYLDKDGKAKQMTGAYYDKNKKCIIFKTSHLSVYAVVYSDNKTVFSDLAKDSWYFDSADFVVSRGLFNGVSQDRFAPQQQMTRAMLVTVLFRLAGEPALNGEHKFADVKSGFWYSGAVDWAAFTQLVKGYDEYLFGTNDSISREALATILYRFAKAEGYAVTDKGDIDKFSDCSSVSAWAVDALRWAVGAGIISGDGGSLKPQDQASRAEVAAMLHRFVLKYFN